MSFREITEKFRNETWKIIYNEEQQEKVLNVKKFGLGGAMLWSIESDDFKGICGRKYPLLNTMKSVILYDVFYIVNPKH
ncbi:PREDICTED: chitotriosidase-1-like [Ceratosolen solmsi marchali]|uniref:Chitotriosidase-1-like n=1 Tax=Ceratosolen solmsi marchali TaxID=326594 RepID=A0AAJ6YVQ1_9HYME|nr:PREDICTED: chitotriosidase-1-like [Ceratosolen solmsi marchali]